MTVARSGVAAGRLASMTQKIKRDVAKIWKPPANCMTDGDKKLDEKKSCRVTDRAGSAQHQEAHRQTSLFVCLSVQQGISHGIKMPGSKYWSRWEEIKDLFGITINHLREFFVQNDPILSSIVKRKPICYADLVDGQGLASDFRFHPDKHRKHMGMVYFQKGKRSVKELIQVHFSF